MTFRHENLINLPFCGFYETILGARITAWMDEYIQHMQEQDSRVNAGTPVDNFMNFRAAKERIAREYVDWFGDWLSRETDTVFNFAFMGLDSPAYYNYRNDEIICAVLHEDKEELYRLATQYGENTLRQVIKARHTSYSGFMSFYSDRLEDWHSGNARKFFSTSPEVVGWDQVQMTTVLLAAVAATLQIPPSQEIYGFLQFLFVEDRAEAIDNILSDCFDHDGFEAMLDEGDDNDDR